MTPYSKLLPLVAILIVVLQAASCKKDKAVPTRPAQCEITDSIKWLKVEAKGRSAVLEWEVPCPNLVLQQSLFRISLDEDGEVISEMIVVLPASLLKYEDTATFPDRKVKYYIEARYTNKGISSSEVIFDADNFYSFNAPNDQFIKATSADKVVFINRQVGKLFFYNYKTHQVDSLILGTSIAGKCAIQEYNGTTELYAYSMQQQRIIVIDVNQGNVVDNVPLTQQQAPKFVLAKKEKLYAVNTGLNDNLSIVRRDNKQVITLSGQGSFDLFGDEGAFMPEETSNDFLLMNNSAEEIIRVRVSQQGAVDGVDLLYNVMPPLFVSNRTDMFCQVTGTHYFIYGRFGNVFDLSSMTKAFGIGQLYMVDNSDYCVDLNGNIYGGDDNRVRVITNGGSSFHYSHAIYTVYHLERILVSDGKLYVFSKKDITSSQTKRFTVEEISLTL